MKEIGETLREAREANGVSIEEAADDLKIRPTQLKNLEEGNIEEFNDIFYVKYFVRNYGKYLGLDGEKLLDEFNEFLFDHTSRIPIDKIKEATKNLKTTKENPNKVISPYTKVNKKFNFFTSKVFYVIVALLILVVGYLIISSFKNDEFINTEAVYIHN